MSNNHNHKNEDFSSLKNDLKGVPHEIELVHHKNHTHDSKNSNKNNAESENNNNDSDKNNHNHHPDVKHLNHEINTHHEHKGHHHHYVHNGLKKYLKSKNKTQIKYTDDKVVLDPLKIYESHVSEDFYSLTWCALKKDIWSNKRVYGEKIFFTNRDYNRLIIEFLIFTALIGFTLFTLFSKIFRDGKIILSSWRIEILRIIIVGFAQRLLYKEVVNGQLKFRFTVKNMDEFHYPYFAAFIPLFQILMAIFSFILIVIYMCVSNEALPLVMHFAEVAVLIELDDWVGEMICKEFPDEGEKPDDVETDNLNNELGFFLKLSMVREDLRIISDYNSCSENPFFTYLDYINSWIPWSIFPLFSTMIFEFLLVKFRPRMVTLD